MVSTSLCVSGLLSLFAVAVHATPLPLDYENHPFIVTDEELYQQAQKYGDSEKILILDVVQNKATPPEIISIVPIVGSEVDFENNDAYADIPLAENQ